MHSFIPTVFISYTLIAAVALFSSLIAPAHAAPILARHGYHTDSQRGYPASAPSSPWSRMYTYGKLADKFLMVNDAYVTDGAALWGSSLKVYNAVSAFRFPQHHHDGDERSHFHQPPQFGQADADRSAESRARLIAKFKKYAMIRNLALSNMQRKIASRVKAETMEKKVESPNVEREGEEVIDSSN